MQTMGRIWGRLIEVEGKVYFSIKIITFLLHRVYSFDSKGYKIFKKDSSACKGGYVANNNNF